MFRVTAPFTLEPSGLKDWSSDGVAEYVWVWVAGRGGGGLEGRKVGQGPKQVLALVWGLHLSPLNKHIGCA